MKYQKVYDLIENMGLTSSYVTKKNTGYPYKIKVYKWNGSLYPYYCIEAVSIDNIIEEIKDIENIWDIKRKNK